MGRSVVWGIVLGVLAVAVGAAAVVVFGPTATSPMTRPGDRVMVVVAARSGTDDGTVAEVVGVADLSRGGLRLQMVDPWMSVTVAGTSYDRLRDTYPFGGGAAVARAYAQAKGGPPIPVVTVSEDGLRAIVSRLGGVTVDVPVDAEVFDGTTLRSFKVGRSTLDADSLIALLRSADYRRGTDGSRLRLAVASGLASAVAADPPALDDLVRAGEVSSSLRAEDLAALGGRLRGTAGSMVLEPSAP